jgi:Protein of unknown function (DUF3072)
VTLLDVRRASVRRTSYVTHVVSEAGYVAVMTDSNTPSNDDLIGAGATGSSTEKDPTDWVTGDEPMTGAQRSYLETLAREAGETLSADLTNAEASEHIDRLQGVTGRGAEPA